MTGRFLRACRAEPVDRPPVWLMRQAGRYLPEYRAVRERAGGFLELCRAPELAAEVTLQPVRRFGLDAAIIFSDILIPAAAMGAEVRFADGEGPRVRADVRELDEPEPREACAFVGEAIRIVRRALPPETALIGFAAAPFTLLCYLLEGEGGRGFERARAQLFAQEELHAGVLTKIARYTARYLAMQLEAGADAVQLFDTWAHLLGPGDRRLALEPARATIEALRALAGAEAPVIYYGPATGLPPAGERELGATVHSIDWRTDLASARHALRVVQGNLDPAVLLAGANPTRERTKRMLDAAGPRPGYIANLGHGVHKDTPVASVEAFVETVAASAGRRAPSLSQTQY